MVATILSHAGLDPTVVVGGRVATMGGSQRARGPERLPGGGSRRERPLVPEAGAHPGRGHQHRPRAPGLLLLARRHPRAVHRVRQQGAVLRRGDRVPGRRERAEHPAGGATAAPSPTAPPRRRTCRPREIGCGHFASDFRLRFRGRGPGPLPPARARRAQRAERHGGGGGGAGTGGQAGRHPRGAGHLQRRGPALPGARPGARHHGDRRLRPPSHRDPRHAGGRAAVRLPPHPRALPAAPLHAHLSPDGRVRARVPPGRHALRAGYLRGLGEAHRGRHGRGAGGAHPRSSAIARWSTWAPWSAAWRRCWTRRRRATWC